MTTRHRAAAAPRSGPDGSAAGPGTAPRTGAVPAVGVTGRVGDAATYTFTDRAAGTLGEVGSSPADDHRVNRRTAAAALGADDVAWMRQVHGGRVVVAGAPGGDPPACDGIVVTRPGVAAGVLAADCVPVLLAVGTDASRPAVAAAHAGRAGLLARVAPATLDRLLDVAGAAASQVHVVIGPAIGPCCYEVGDDMAAAVEEAVPGTRSVTTWGTSSVDLVAGVVGQLRAAGVRHIGRAGGCTRCEDRWWSHRASGRGAPDGTPARPPGRNAGLVLLLGGAP